jgi:hypothetical protein
MTTRERFHAWMAERRRFKKGSAEHEYMTRAARKLVWIMRRVPTTEWPV